MPIRQGIRLPNDPSLYNRLINSYIDWFRGEPLDRPSYYSELGPAVSVTAPTSGGTTSTFGSYTLQPSPDLESTGRTPGAVLANLGPEATIPYERARRDLRRVLAEMQFARTRAAALARQQINRILEDLPWALMGIEGEEAAYGMGRSGQLYAKLGLARRDALRTIYDILSRLADYLGETYQQGITTRFGMQDTGIGAMLSTFGQRAGELQSIFK